MWSLIKSCASKPSNSSFVCLNTQCYISYRIIYRGTLPSQQSLLLCDLLVLDSFQALYHFAVRTYAYTHVGSACVLLFVSIYTFYII